MRLKVFETNTEHEAALPHEDYPNIVCWISGDNSVIYHREEITIQKMIERGYAFRDTDTLSGDNAYIQIESDCPYAVEDIVDFDQYNYIWREPLPQGWSSDEVIAMYNGKTLSIAPQGGMFWGLDFSNCENFSLSFGDTSWNIVSYPWNSGGKETGIFTSKHPVSGGYISHNTPKNITLSFVAHDGVVSSVFQEAFNSLTTTEHVTISAVTTNNSFVYVHDWNGAFEGCINLTGITFNRVNMYAPSQTFSDIEYMCCDCQKLKKFPLGRPEVSFNNVVNTLTPGTRTVGGRNVRYAFYHCTALEEIEPLLDFQYVTAGADTCFEGCTSLTHLRIKNLGISWDFSENPLNKDSIEFILNNVKDYSGTSTHPTLLFGDGESDVSTAAKDNAQACGWGVSWA